jgi:PIN domain nuclease of toxin-antitoxin system
MAGGLEDVVKLLLDTHAFLWTALLAKRLSPVAVDAIEDSENEVFVSAASAWEIEIKRAKGKLQIPDKIEEALLELRFLALSVGLDHVLAVEGLPRHHRDPFDRILIAQAQLEGMTLVTSDRRIREYPVAVLPAG